MEHSISNPRFGDLQAGSTVFKGLLPGEVSRLLQSDGGHHSNPIRFLNGIVGLALMMGGVNLVLANDSSETDPLGMAVKPLSISCESTVQSVGIKSSAPCAVSSADVSDAGAIGDDSSSGLSVSSVLEFETEGGETVLMDSPHLGLTIPDEEEADSGAIYIRRVSTTLAGSEGKLTVGNNWSNFQDFLMSAGGPAVEKGLTSEQLVLAANHPLGEITLALEQDFRLTGHDHPTGISLSELNDEEEAASPSLSLSWRSVNDDQSRYGLSAMGREIQEFDEEGNTEKSTTGWGLNLFGGWQFGKLFAAISVTLGNSIDSFILGREGDRETATSATRFLHPGNSVNINPTLNYQLSEKSNIHLSLNRFSSEAEETAHGVETLDTIHLGYSWAPWPSTQLGIEFVGKDVEGQGTMEDSNKLNIKASKRF